MITIHLIYLLFGHYGYMSVIFVHLIFEKRWCPCRNATLAGLTAFQVAAAKNTEQPAIGSDVIQDFTNV